MRSCHIRPARPCHTWVGRLGVNAGEGLSLKHITITQKGRRSLQLVFSWSTDSPLSWAWWNPLGAAQLSSRKAPAVFSVGGGETLGWVLRKGLSRESLKSCRRSKSDWPWKRGRGCTGEGMCLQSIAQERSSLRHRHSLEKGLPGCIALPGDLYGGEVIKLLRCLLSGVHLAPAVSSLGSDDPLAVTSALFILATSLPYILQAQ